MEPFSATSKVGLWQKLVIKTSNTLQVWLFTSVPPPQKYGVCSFMFAQDKEETAQWVASPATLKAILESCLARVSTLKGQTLLVHHYTQYDGNFEKAGLGREHIQRDCLAHVCVYICSVIIIINLLCVLFIVHVLLIEVL